MEVGMAGKKMVGEIIDIKGDPDPNSYIIKDKEGRTYLVHVGDIEENEQLLYRLYKENKKEKKTVKLEYGDSVEFQPDSQVHAIHVKKTC